MKLNTVTLLALTILLLNCQPTQAPTEATTSTETQEMTYDSLLAQRLGADDYGMKPYVMAFLKAGPNRSENPEEAVQLQRAHLDNIKRLAAEGKLVLAGPFMDDGEIRGIYIFDVSTVEEAQALTETDPAIQAGSLVMELRPWYGSAMLMELNKMHTKVAKEEI